MIDLKEFVAKTTDEAMKKAGFTLQETPTQKQKTQETTPISGKITFLKEESAKREAVLYQRTKEKE